MRDAGLHLGILRSQGRFWRLAMVKAGVTHVLSVSLESDSLRPSTMQRQAGYAAGSRAGEDLEVLDQCAGLRLEGKRSRRSISDSNKRAWSGRATLFALPILVGTEQRQFLALGC